MWSTVTDYKPGESPRTIRLALISKLVLTSTDYLWEWLQTGRRQGESPFQGEAQAWSCTHLLESSIKLRKILNCWGIIRKSTDLQGPGTDLWLLDAEKEVKCLCFSGRDRKPTGAQHLHQYRAEFCSH